MHRLLPVTILLAGAGCLSDSKSGFHGTSGSVPTSDDSPQSGPAPQSGEPAATREQPGEPAQTQEQPKRPDLAGIDNELNLVLLDGAPARDVSVAADAAGVAVRVQDGGRTAYVGRLGAGRLEIARVVAGRLTVLATAPFAATPRRLELNAQGDSLVLLADEKPLVQTRDTVIATAGGQAVFPRAKAPRVIRHDVALKLPRKIASPVTTWTLVKGGDDGSGSYRSEACDDVTVILSGDRIAMRDCDCVVIAQYAQQSASGTARCAANGAEGAPWTAKLDW